MYRGILWGTWVPNLVFLVILGHCVPEYTRGYPSTTPSWLGVLEYYAPGYTLEYRSTNLVVWIMLECYVPGISPEYIPHETHREVACSREAMGGNG